MSIFSGDTKIGNGKCFERHGYTVDKSATAKLSKVFKRYRLVIRSE